MNFYLIYVHSMYLTLIENITLFKYVEWFYFIWLMLIMLIVKE